MGTLAGLELGRHQAKDSRHQADERGDHGSADLDDHALKGADFAAQLAKLLIHPREARVHSPFKVVESSVGADREVVET
jgi:hypothetical protein